MRIAELSRRSGVPLSTIKYYLRAGLLPAGTPSAPNQADYGQEHLHRLRLIGVLRKLGGLSLAQVKSVLDALDEPAGGRHRLLGLVHRALASPPAPPASDEELAAARAEVDSFVARLGWKVAPDAPALTTLAAALAALREQGLAEGAEVFAPYARAAEQIAAYELSAVAASEQSTSALELTVIGTVVFEAALSALRRLAQEHHSALLFRTRSRPARA